ncbi:MAG: restriction endonuclease subunit S [Oceanospirillaceae bacterium]|nr:restriction endonuclease subunit S [Oceanospirillaceae bacterium]
MGLNSHKSYHEELESIPNEWKVIELGQAGTFSKGKGIKKDEVLFYGNPCVRYGEIYTKYDNVITRFESFVNEETSKNSIRIFKGDIIFAGSGETKEEIGKCAAIDTSEKAFAGGDIIILRPSGYNSNFLGYLLNAPFIAKQKAIKGQGDAVVHIYSSGLSQICIPVPPKKEQDSIAQALSDIDSLINNLDKLIDKRKAIKQGAMQQLLKSPTQGGKRLMGFEGEWIETTIGEVAKVGTGSKNTQDKVEDGKYPFFVRSQTVERINTYSFDGEGILTAGDGVGTGKVFHYVNEKVDIHQRVYLISDFSSSIHGYFLYLVFKENFYERIISMTAKSSVDSVRKEMITNMKIFVPPTRIEQETIAKIISDMDKEIGVLETKKSKYLNIKKGMMQDLLTGKTRLV